MEDQVPLWLDIIRHDGIAIAVLIAIGLGGWYVLKRLFNKDDGIFTAVSKRHVEFVDELASTQKQIAEATESISANFKAQTLILKDVQHIKEEFDPAALRKAGLIACDIIDELIAHEMIPESVKPLGREMRETLQRSGT